MTRRNRFSNALSSSATSAAGAADIVLVRDYQSRHAVFLPLARVVDSGHIPAARAVPDIEQNAPEVSAQPWAVFIPVSHSASHVPLFAEVRASARPCPRPD